MHRIVCFFICFGMSVCGHMAAQVDVAPAGTLISSKAVAFNSPTGKTYAVDANHNAIWVLDASAGSKVEVDVGSGASAVAVNRKTGRAYASMPGDGTVVILDGGTDSIMARVKVGPHPYTLAVDDIRNRVYLEIIGVDVRFFRGPAKEVLRVLNHVLV
jgi:DNA-binding beta-propeller fold protein YncE